MSDRALLHTVIPAAPGWWLLHKDDETGEVFKTVAILAWLFVGHVDLYELLDYETKRSTTSIVPITNEGATGDFYGYLRPDGTVEIPAAEWGETLDAHSERQKIIHRRAKA